MFSHDTKTMPLEPIIQHLEERIGILFSKESSGHDIYHLKRVYNLALTLQQKEGGDKIIIGVSAFLHDIHRIIQNETGKYCEPKDSLPTIKNLLKEISLTKLQKEKILHCIEFHEEYDFSSYGKTSQEKETLILQDADNLDAMGAIGIARTFTFGGAHNIGLRKPDESSLNRTVFDENKIDGSSIHHFYNKLLKLKENMNTPTAKEMAKQRHIFMEKFLEEFFEERDGKK